MSTRVQVPHADIDAVRGAWGGLSLDGGGRTAIVSCPGCARLFCLVQFIIEPDGSVHGPPGKPQSVVCPSGCGFHAEPLVLEGWRP